MSNKKPKPRKPGRKVTKPKVTARPSRQTTKQKGVAAIVEDSRKPSMSGAAVRPRLIKRKIVVMPDDPSPSKAMKNTMDPVPKSARRRSKAPGRPGDQVPSVDPGPQEEGRGYFRIRMRMAEGELTVSGAKFVAGPLRGDESVSPGLTYDAKIGRKRVAFGDVPDPIEWRSHPDPNAKGETAGHHVTELSDYDFIVRIPSEQVTEQAIQDLRVTLYRWRGQGPGEHISITELIRQPKVAVEELGSMSGLRISSAPVAFKKELQQAFKQAASSAHD
ncbi:MAG: hypothetical protein BMS9Abin17_0425 [Acidimicrobiia bacterium]|nr:MAG: hypothetical protein BMS9Abin17_0425 [Acidimicrobiia bacterium]